MAIKGSSEGLGYTAATALIKKISIPTALPSKMGIMSISVLTLFYTRGLGIVVSHVMVPLPYRFSL
jgi:hypothetical protein